MATVAREQAALDDIILRLGIPLRFRCTSPTHQIPLVATGAASGGDYGVRASAPGNKTDTDTPGKRTGGNQSGIEHDLAQAIDDQGFFLVEGLRELDGPRYSINERASEDELTTYRNLASVNHRANLAVVAAG